MANKKRDRNGYRKQLGRYRLNRTDILALEKILRTYADAKEMKAAGLSELPTRKKHMPRKYVDRYIKIGRYRPFHIKFGRGEYGIYYPGVDYIYDADSVKFLPKHIKKTRYVEIACFPGVSVTFTPLTTTVYGQTHYATGKELMVMRKTISNIEDYLARCRKGSFNLISIK